MVRGYVSKIDGSVQPYGLVVPASYRPDTPHRFRLDVWCHGRGENLSEVNFIDGRQTSPGEFTPPNAFVLHPYGRYCNANKFAGEIDLFEALDEVKKHYPIDDDRIVDPRLLDGRRRLLAVRRPLPRPWAAAAPGAGFAETADFLKVFQNETVQPTWYEQKLWHLYDCTDYAVNLFNCPTVAYSGEIDGQKQAADMMAKALKEEGIELIHIIGPRPSTTTRPTAKAEIKRRIDRSSPSAAIRYPQQVDFTHLDAALQPVLLGAGRRPGAALGTRPGSTPTCREPQSRIQVEDHDQERLGPDAGDSSGLLPTSTSPGRPTVSIDGKMSWRRPAALRPLLDCPFPQGRRTLDARSPRTTTALCASATACKARSTTRSWTPS